MGLELIAAATFLAGLALGFAWRAARRPPVVRTAEAPVPQERERRSDERFDALVRALPLGVIMLDRALRVRFANRAAAAIFGFERTLARGKHVIAAAPLIELERRAHAALRGEQSGPPMIIAGKNVNRRYAVSVYPLASSDDDGAEAEIAGVLVLAEDQTELLALERARQEFLTNVSHELRTPLTSIKLMLETVLEPAEDRAAAPEAQPPFVPQALAQVDRLIALVQRLLEQARVESGMMILELREVDLEAAAKPIVQSFEPQAASKHVTMRLQATHPVLVNADEQRLSQIFVNLVDNALRYTTDGGTITVALGERDGFAEIRVSDTGIGIPFRDLPHVFERFYVVDRSRARGYGGAGLGLAIVKEIAQAHHGDVRVDSTLGSGTTVTVRLPVEREP